MLKSSIAAILALTAVPLSFAAPHGPPTAPAQPVEKESHNEGPGWSYTGPTGPAHWGDIDPNSRACKYGIQQSPVDLGQPVSAFISAPQIDWREVHTAELVNNGHTLQMNLANAGGIVRNGKLFKLVQFHFHTPSEHTINGRRFPMEVHFVHQASDGALAVIGVMFAEGANNENLDPIFWAAPNMVGKAAVSFDFDANDLLPKNRSSMLYQGSLTTPPCSEIVDWTIMTTPINASKSQITVFKSMFGENARPVQPLHRRYILATPQ